jgi:hypothetical protein
MKRRVHPGPDRRVLIRDGSTMSLRVESGVGFRNGSALPSWAIVEWSGRIGHPSSYGLLGGAPSRVPSVNVSEAGGRFADSLAGSVDEVRWGLPLEYERPVLEELVALPRPVDVTHAAHGLAGSSEMVFRALTRLLCQILTAGLPTDDLEVWKLRDRCWNDS